MARHEIATKKVVYEIAGAEAVTVRRDVPYSETENGPLCMDIYYPPSAFAGTQLPAVVFVIGVSDAGARARLGCACREMESYIGWARLVAMSGAIAIAYETSADPAVDLAAVVERIRADAASLGVDDRRIAVWACSAHGATALTMLMQDAPARAACAVLYYPYTIDLDGATGIAEARQMWGFKTPAAGRTADDLRLDVPTLVVRAGLDQMPHLNVALDRFVAAALARNLPITLVNHADGPHAFDLMDDSDTSRAIVRQTLAFLQAQLGV